MLGLRSRTPAGWAERALADEVSLLRDHAHLERKAAGHAITLLGHLPEASEAILRVAREELDHFERVCALLRARGAGPGPDRGNPYVRMLASKGDRSLLDRLLRMSLVEARSYERFCLLAEAAQGDLRTLYGELKESEASHHAFFLKLAHDRWPREEVRSRLDALAEEEARVVAEAPAGSRIH